MTKNKPFVYRMVSTDNLHTFLALSKLAAAPHSKNEASYNAIALREHKETLAKLRQMDTKQLEKLAKHSIGVVSYLIDLDCLQNNLNVFEKNVQQYEEELQRVRWLVTRKASNQMIVDLCPLVTVEEIKKVRLDLGIPVSRGRLKMPDTDTRLQILKAWQNSQSEKNLYLRYQSLSAEFLNLDLGQLYTVITDDKYFGG